MCKCAEGPDTGRRAQIWKEAIDWTATVERSPDAVETFQAYATAAIHALLASAEPRRIWKVYSWMRREILPQLDRCFGNLDPRPIRVTYPGRREGAAN